MPKCSPIHKVTDDARWAAEDLFGRLCIIAHAAFLYAGFHPSSAPAAKPWSLSRTYSVLPPAAARHQDKTAVVLRLYRPWGRNRRGRAHMALRAYAVTASGGGRYIERRERLGANASSDYFADRSKDHTGNNDIAWEDSKVKKERRTEEEVLQEGLKEHHGADAVHSPSSRVPYLPILEAPMMP